jgi:hypothetical protein
VILAAPGRFCTWGFVTALGALLSVHRFVDFLQAMKDKAISPIENKTYRCFIIKSFKS